MTSSTVRGSRASASASHVCACARVSASSAANGSSRHSSGRPASSVRRNATRWRIPPLSAAGRVCSKPSSPKRAKCACAAARASFATRPRPAAPAPRCPARSATAAARRAAASARPRARRRCRRPARRARTPATAASTSRTRSGPTTATTSPAATRRSTPSSATTSPNALRTPDTVTPSRRAYEAPSSEPRPQSASAPSAGITPTGSKGQRRTRGAISAGRTSQPP